MLLVLCFAASAVSAGWVSGYFRQDGTYVPGYYRSDPNNTVTDNYSFYGNLNPYTGAIGTNRYYSAPSSPYYNPFRTYTSPYSSYTSPYSSPYSTYTSPRIWLPPPRVISPW